MRDVLTRIQAWRREGRRVALATVVQTWGSAPRPAGSRMAVSEDGGLEGSVSGGCVETAVVEAARAVLKGGGPRLLRFGVADETAWAVGLACGGTVEVFVDVLDDSVAAAAERAVRDDDAAALLTVIAGAPEVLGRQLLLPSGGEVTGSLPGPLRETGLRALREALGSRQPARVAAGEAELFVDVLAPPSTLVVVGGVHIAIALVGLARTLGYRTVVVDPRPAFASRERFPEVDRLETLWPDEALPRVGLTSSTAVAVLTHDPKLDDPALRAALPSPAFYVGALGSPRTQEKRRHRLLESGLEESTVARLHAPIGLDLGGRSPEEIALAVMAEVVAARHGRAPARGRAPSP